MHERGHAEHRAVHGGDGAAQEAEQALEGLGVVRALAHDERLARKAKGLAACHRICGDALCPDDDIELTALAALGAARAKVRCLALGLFRAQLEHGDIVTRKEGGRQLDKVLRPVKLLRGPRVELAHLIDLLVSS